ncbi:hypothetical protein VNI00_016747 [Paramarasmius palmivorus]|uniref:Uncharacterized protein n=1 Tax=Paramarasmius palmivorus TaxID=297713 RepID=A0AAW0BCV8_9AGAR
MSPPGTNSLQETIERVEWSGRKWLYFIKWYGWEPQDNTWEPLTSLHYCERVCKEFWKDVGGPGPRKGREKGFTLTSKSCLERIRAQHEENGNNTQPQVPASLQTLQDESTEANPVATSFKSHSDSVIQVPDASLLFNPPEALGLHDLCADDHYQTVFLSLGAKKINVREILYKKAKNDSKEDPSWRRAGCSICYDGEDLDDSGRLLACRCRSHIYCKVCVEKWIAKSRVRADGLISCPQCRCIVYTVSSAWVFLSPDEEKHRTQYQESRKAKKRVKNKQNKREAEARKRAKLTEEAQERKKALRANRGL